MDHRPESFREYIGQQHLKERIQLLIDANGISGRPLPSILLVAPPGVGKTSLAYLIAKESFIDMESMRAPVEQSYLRSIIESHQGLVYIDEVHALTRKQQEYLLPVIEDRTVATRFGSELPVYVSIIASTTEGDKIIRPLWDRFRVKPTFDPYTDEEMTQITLGMARKYHLTVDEEWATGIALASLGSPRNVRSLVEIAWEITTVTRELPSVREVLLATRTTPAGLSIEHVRYCEVLQHAGGIAGLETMRQLLGMPAGHIERLEIDLIRQRLVVRTGRGRELTGLGMRLVR